MWMAVWIEMGKKNRMFILLARGNYDGACQGVTGLWSGRCH